MIFNKIYESEKVLLPLMIQENYYKKEFLSNKNVNQKIDTLGKYQIQYQY